MTWEGRPGRERSSFLRYQRVQISPYIKLLPTLCIPFSCRRSSCVYLSVVGQYSHSISAKMMRILIFLSLTTSLAIGKITLSLRHRNFKTMCKSLGSFFECAWHFNPELLSKVREKKNSSVHGTSPVVCARHMPFYVLSVFGGEMKPEEPVRRKLGKISVSKRSPHSSVLAYSQHKSGNLWELGIQFSATGALI